jgi:hypothetical protein
MTTNTNLTQEEMMREKLAESNSLIEHPNPQKWAQSIV